MNKLRGYSRIIAGTMTWGSWGKKLKKKEMARLMNHCRDIGITTFDHADIYGGYTTEADFGAAFAESGLERDSIQLITKAGIQYVCEARKNRIKHYEYSGKYLVWSVEESLKNLRTDYLDLFLLHRPSPLMDPDEISDAITRLIEEGKIREFGVSNFLPHQISMLETVVPVSANQVEFSLTADTVMYDGTLDDCIAKGRMPMAWSPLGGYFQSEGERAARIKAVLAKMKEKYDADESQLLLAWILKHPSHTHPVVGTTVAERLVKAADATEIKLELEDWFELLKASQGHKVP